MARASSPRRGAAERRPEPRFPIRLVALDIDGTLLDRDMILRDRTRAAVRAAIAHGAIVVLATGRMASSVRPLAEAIGLRGALIAYQGALIRELPAPGEPGPGRLLRHDPIPTEVARATVRWAYRQGLRPHLNHLERFIVPVDDPNAEDYSLFLGARAELVDDLEAAIEHPITKVIAVAETPLPDGILDAARTEFAGRASPTISHPRFLEFVAPGVSKGRAVRWLARRLGVPLEQTLAIGDQHNDVEMIRAVGHGVAMAGAPADVRAAARYLAPPVSEEGAAQILEALVVPSPTAAERNAQRFRMCDDHGGQAHEDEQGRSVHR
jgi:Cof subfamily protein (haloacid dehalogenase superfamily)